MDNITKLRQLLGSPSENLISDDLLEHFLNEEGDLNLAASAAARVIARNYSLKAEKSLGKISINYMEQSNSWKEIAREFEKDSASLAKPITGSLT